LPAGAVLTGSTVTGEEFKFELRSVERGAANLIKLFSNTHTGLIMEGKDGALAHGAKSDIADLTVGGETRNSIHISPPFQGILAGETYVEYEVQVPATRPVLSFSIGLDDGLSTAADIICRVSVDKKELWRERVSSGAWQSKRIDLSAYAGESVRLRLITGLS